MRYLLLLFILLVITPALSADTLTTFQPGGAISSAEMNANFQALAQKIAQLEQNQSPTGAIIASLQAPQADGFLGANQSWYNCVGGTVNGVTVPDLRGVFLRGLDQGAGKDLDGAARAAGSYQEDEFKRHNHTTGVMRQVFQAGYNGTGMQYTDQLKSGTEHTGGTETRPKNIAVYYYIKVK